MNRALWLGLIVINILAIGVFISYTNDAAVEDRAHIQVNHIEDSEDSRVADEDAADLAISEQNAKDEQLLRDIVPEENLPQETIRSNVVIPDKTTSPPAPLVTSSPSPARTLGSCDGEELQLHKRNQRPSNGTFQQVGNDTYVYEAYFDARQNRTTYVRIIAAAALNATVYCHLWFDDVKPIVMKAEIYVRLYYKPVPYKSVLVNCEYNRTDDVAPKWVVLSPSECGPPHAILKVLDNRRLPQEANFTVCLHKALYNNYGWPELLVEWIEVNRMFGAQKFLLYYYNHSESLMPYIKHYIDMGLVEYRSWPLHRVDNKISIYKAQVSVINDCIYRSMYKTKYLALMDPDELLVPEKHDTWNELMDNAPCQNEPGILFRNHIFVLSEEPDER
ncbi:hypothetical protein CAPTEDRAFT_221921, partial [Capitella teleta]